MNAKTMLLLTSLGAGALAPSAALASGNARAVRTLDVEIVDTLPRTTPHATHQSLAVTDDAGWTSVTTHGPAEVSIRARSNDDHRGNVLLEVDLHRGGDTSAGSVDVASTFVFVAGQRIPLSRVERADGSIVELFVTAR